MLTGHGSGSGAERFSGILQVDGYDGYNILARPDRSGGPVTLAYCWAHRKRRLKAALRG